MSNANNNLFKLANILKQESSNITPYLQDCFKYLHQNPELSFQEFETTCFIQKELTSFGVKLQDIDSKVGVVGLLQGGKPGPCVALRADIDALPIQEESSCTFPSKKQGIFHGCGHDAHTAALLGAAKILSSLKEELPGTVKFIFQPAEEGAGGAKYLTQKGCMDHPKVDAVFGLHNAPTVASYKLGLKTGGIMAAVHKFTVTLTGKGGHGAIPETNIDSIVAAAAMIQSLQTITSRNVPPSKACVVSVCSIHGGDVLTFNVNPETVTFCGTCRCYSPEMEILIQKRFHDIVENIASAYQVKAKIQYETLHSAVINPKELYETAVSVAEVLNIPYECPIASTAGDDFSTFSEYAPSYFYWLGNYSEEKDTVYPLHSPKFKIDTDTLSLGASVYAMSAIMYLMK